MNTRDSLLSPDTLNPANTNPRPGLSLAARAQHKALQCLMLWTEWLRESDLALIAHITIFLLLVDSFSF